MTTQILTQSHLKSIFDYKNGEFYWKIIPNRKIRINSKAGSISTNGYKYTKINNKIYSIHRLIYIWHHGYCPKEIDHIDCNRLNNRIENLREATRFQNGANQKTRKTNSSGYKNIHWSKKAKKWQVTMRIDGNMKYFGIFDDIELAELVATEARNKYKKEYAKHF
jgi:hypothetical protein